MARRRRPRKTRRGGRPKLFSRRIVLPLPDGVLEEIDELLADETRLDFIRAAIKAEIARRRRSLRLKAEMR
jgi:metal-responsive CopG/Arc/MetJ family transcriptional regulator